MKRAKHIVDNITLALLRQEAIAAYNARSALSLYGWPLNAGARNLLSKYFHPAALCALKAAA